MVELIGIIAAALVFVSMTFPSTSRKANMLMRSVNSIGSMFFVAYGLLLPAFSTALLNGAVIIVNGIYIWKEYQKRDS